MRQKAIPSGAFLFAMRSQTRSFDLSWLGLAALLLLAAYLRFTHADWDGGNQLHPDERAILFVASDLHIPSDLPQALDPHLSPLNPFRNLNGSARPYPYGHLPLYLNVTIARILSQSCSHSDSCSTIDSETFVGRLLNVDHASPYIHYTYVGRALSALFDCLTIIATFLLTRRLFTPFAALTASGMHTVSVINIQNSHFGTVDLPLSLFCTLTILFLVVYSESNRIEHSILGGVCAGLALGSKASAIYLAVPILVTHLEFRPSVKLARMEIFWLTVLAGVSAFAITNPYSILDFVEFIRSVITQAQVTSGGADFPFTRQYYATMPIIYVFDQQARAFLGPLLALTIMLSLIVGICQLRQLSYPQRIVILWIAINLLSAGLQYAKFPRYMLPSLPAMYTFASGILSSSWLRQWQKNTLALVALVPTAVYAFSFVQMYKSPHPWVATSEWIYTSLPPQTKIISELWDDPLPLDITLNDEVHLREAYVASILIHPFEEPDNLNKLNVMAEDIASSDYIILSSNRLYGTIPRLRTRYPITSAYYRKLFAEELGFTLEHTFSRYPTLFGISLIDDPLTWPSLHDPGIEWPETALRVSFVDESFTIYDHPLVLVFQNRESLSQAEIVARILEGVK